MDLGCEFSFCLFDGVIGIDNNVGNYDESGGGKDFDSLARACNGLNGEVDFR